MKRRVQRRQPRRAKTLCLTALIAGLLVPGLGMAATQESSTLRNSSITLAQRYGQGHFGEQDPADAAATEEPYGTGYESRFERMDRFDRPERALRPERPERPPIPNRPERPDRGGGRQ